jgi:hypothetical protein
MHTPSDDPPGDAAEQLTDTLDRLEWSQPLDAAPEGALLATLSLNDGGSPGMRLLAEIARVHRAVQVGGGSRPETLFRWGHLEVLRPLGTGSYGEVYAAWDPQLQREVALKLARVRAGTLRWLDEARSLARVHHPNVLIIHGADLGEERAGLWTEQVRGRTLEEELREHGPLPPGEVLRIGHDLASALAAVHAAGIVHGDLKTSNVMIEDAPPPGASDPPGTRGQTPTARRVVLMDFGAARLADARDGGSAITTTPMFAAPEVLAGGTPGVRSDVYALGVVLYRLLTAAWPVEADTVAQLIAAHERGARVPLATRRSDVPPRLARIVERALAPDPVARFASSADVRDALGRLLGQRPRLHPAQVALTVLAFAAVAALTLALRHQLEMLDANKVAIPPAPTLAMSTRPWWTTPPDTLLCGLGWFVSGADFDGDGRADVLVSDAAWSRDQPQQGRAVAFAPARDGVDRAPAWAFIGRRSNDLIGASVSRAGDVNGDGFEDALVRDPGNLMGGPVATGAVLLFLGSRRGLASEPASVVVSDTPGSGFGNRIAAAGDVNHDGFADVMVSEHNWNGEHRNQGRALLYLGGPRGLNARPAQALVGDPISGAFGWDVTGVGDINHDGYDDVMVGSGFWQDRRGEVGAVDLYLGGPNGLQRAPSSRIEGDRNGDGVGGTRSVAGIGDVNGDGFGDVAIGVLGHDDRGAECGEVRVYLGRHDGLERRPVWRAEGYGSACELGFSVAPARDVDGDGLPDLLVSGYGFTPDHTRPSQGAVFLYRGAGPKRLFERTPAWWATETQPEALFGAAVDLADVDDDGRADVIVGAPHWRNGSTGNGRVYVFRGGGGRRAVASR